MKSRAIGRLGAMGAVVAFSLMPLSSVGAENVIRISTTSAPRCDHIQAVCGVMPHDRLVSFSNECDAKAAGSLRILFGDCHDDD